jgi:uracil-DNA glycosylase family 4
VLRGEWQAVFPPEGDDPQAPVWLVLVDGPSADPREGDAGRLLLAMLRAAGLHKGARVWACSVGRAGDEGEPLTDALRQALAAHRPAMVLTLGRLASQAVLATAEPLGKLRGQVFSVGQADPVPLVASYEPGWLLRSQDDKARAWEDLCRALSAVRRDPP